MRPTCLWMIAAIGAGLTVFALSLGQEPPRGGPPPRLPGPLSLARLEQRLCEDHDAVLAGVLAFDKVQLALTEAENGDWNTFVAMVDDVPDPLQSLCSATPQPGEMTGLLRRVDRLEQLDAAGLEAIKRIRPALAELYGRLTPEQRQTADRLTIPPPPSLP
jgi:protein CpxP